MCCYSQPHLHEASVIHRHYICTLIQHKMHTACRQGYLVSQSTHTWSRYRDSCHTSCFKKGQMYFGGSDWYCRFHFITWTEAKIKKMSSFWWLQEIFTQFNIPNQFSILRMEKLFLNIFFFLHYSSLAPHAMDPSSIRHQLPHSL